MLSDYIDTEIENLLSCIDLSLDKFTAQKRLAMREAMLSTMKKSLDNGERAVLAKASQKMQGDAPTDLQVYRWFQESTVAHHIEEDGGHISKRAMFVATKAWQAAKAMPIQDDLKEGFAIIEEALKKVSSGDLSEAPFTLTGDIAKAYLSGSASAYQHCLEMCNVSEVKTSC